MVGVPTADGMIIGIKAGGTSSYTSPKLTGSNALKGSIYYPFDFAGTGGVYDGSISLTDAVTVNNIYYNLDMSAVSNAPRYVAAFRSSYGTQEVGMAFHVGTSSEVGRVASSLSMTAYTKWTNVNSVVLGYLYQGPRIHIQNYDLANDETNTVRIAADNVAIGTTTGNGGLQVGVKTITDTNTTLDHTWHVVLCDGTTAYTVTLGSAAKTGVLGRMYHIKKRSASTVSLTIATTSSQTIDGSTTLTITQQYTSLCLVSDGSNWNII